MPEPLNGSKTKSFLYDNNSITSLGKSTEKLAFVKGLVSVLIFQTPEQPLMKSSLEIVFSPLNCFFLNFLYAIITTS